MLTVDMKRVLSALKAREMAAAELAFEIGQPEETVKPAILAMQTEGLLSEEGGLLSLTEKGAAEVQEPEGFVILPMSSAGPKPANGNGGNTDAELSEREQLVANLLKAKQGKPFGLDEIARTLGVKSVEEEIARLMKLGIVEMHNRHYRITAQSALNIPLSAEEKVELRRLEAEIKSFVDDIESKMSLVAENLRTIRDKKLYRSPTCKRFGDYIAAHFDRTRDWAYKMIQAVEVREGLQEGNDENVVALLQTLTTRETPHLAKLKKEPAKMQKAWLMAEEEAKAAGRLRTTNDVMKAVEAVQDEGKKKDEKGSESTPAPRKVRTVTVTGLKYNGGDTEDLPGWLREFAGWLHKNPTDDAFTIKVSKAKAAA